MTAQQYREIRDKVYEVLIVDGYKEIDISLAILGQNNVPEALKSREEILSLKKLIHSVTNL